ncbi:uncharacterized protein LOC135154779 [Lytechinus pictus]|uniref:uncharacterized protein LOC135154779 n=1 Tax=Lytechinus pictus TaxID=7653 RepID=UPI0030B9E02F
MDLQDLPINPMDTHNSFTDGNFVTQKSSHRFSALAHDQVHEQQNAVVKGDGGVIGITENEAALCRWMVAGPEIARIMSEYEDQFQSEKEPDVRHHEQLPSMQKSFATDLNNTISSFEKLGNPFDEDTKDLYVLDTKVVMPHEAVATLRSIEETGKAQHNKFLERMKDPSGKFYDKISKNNLAIFKSKAKKVHAKSLVKMTNMKSNVELFSRMYISCQARDGDIDTFFEHECHSWPPALAENIDTMRPPTSKADLVPCLEALVPRTKDIPKAEVCIFDGAALVHQLEPKKCNDVIKTFGDYAEKQFLPYIARKLNEETVVRVDVVWDTYRTDSLKGGTRLGRGTGMPLHVTEQTPVPLNWSSFLRVDSNKKTLFNFLAASLQTMSVPDGKTLLTTQEEEVKSKPSLNVWQNIQPCTHEEADSRMVLHAWQAYQQGFRSIIIHATDTDVVVLAIAMASKMDGVALWLAFGHGRILRYIAAHTISRKLGLERSWGLLFLHAVTGCDTVSALSGIGKKTVWDVWNSMPNLGEVFNRLSNAPFEVTNDDMDTIERFFVVLYSRTSSLKKVNEARKQLFAQGNRQLENIPPTKEALRQHVKRAVYQAGHIWGQSQKANPELPSPADWGWTKDDEGWHPF